MYPTKPKLVTDQVPEIRFSGSTPGMFFSNFPCFQDQYSDDVWHLKKIDYFKKPLYCVWTQGDLNQKILVKTID